MKNHTEIADTLWHVADLIKDDYDAKSYEDVILPFTLLRRLDCVLEPTRDKVREAAKKYKSVPDKTRAELLMKAAGQKFYNTSDFSLSELVKRPADIGENFGKYLSGFSPNVIDILYNFSGGEEKGLKPLFDTLLRKRLLFKVTQTFSEAPLDMDSVDNHGMGTIFEYLIRKFKEASNEAAGQFYTPRDIIRLMVKLLFEPDRKKLASEKLIGIYDCACGTGGMLTVAKEYLLSAINADLEVYLYGQEINEKTYAIAKADMLMKGEDPENIKRENTLTHDLLPGKQFNYMLTNPPFGKDWKNIHDEIENEHRRGKSGRYAPGLPDVGDGTLLFLLHKMSKMAPQGSKIAIIFSASPLFNGDAGSGPSNIRKYILQNDLLDAIIALPKDLFYNTGLSTYIWMLDNRKPKQRQDKVQLIDASGEAFATALRRNLGAKRVEINEEQADAVVETYEAFEDSPICRIFDTTDFGYTKVTVERPLRLRYDLTPEQLATFCLDKEYLKIKDDRSQQVVRALNALAIDAPWNDDVAFFEALTERLPFNLTQGQIKSLRANLAVKDEMARPVHDDDGNLVPDPALRDYEKIPLKTDIDTYFTDQVLRYVPDAWLDRERDKVGYEISFTKYFYEYASLRSTAEIAEQLLAIDAETENLLREIIQA